MVVFEQPPRAGGFLTMEVNPRFRDTCAIAQGGRYEAGTVMGRRTGDGQAAPLDPAADDGTDEFYGVLFKAVDTTDRERPGVFVRRLCELSDSRLIWPEGITDAQKAAVVAQADHLHALIR